ncbi:hypothetical protein EBZ39_15955 [bacterium]|nr:hypothetical protein [bacterium]
MNDTPYQLTVQRFNDIADSHDSTRGRVEIKMKGKFPKCFNSLEDYEEWKSFARYSLPLYKHCEDCLPSYKLKMRKQNRCENLKVKFALVDGVWVGFIPSERKENGSA